MRIIIAGRLGKPSDACFNLGNGIYNKNSLSQKPFHKTPSLRPRTNKRHVADQDIENLQDLV